MHFVQILIQTAMQRHGAFAVQPVARVLVVAEDDIPGNGKSINLSCILCNAVLSVFTRSDLSETPEDQRENSFAANDFSRWSSRTDGHRETE